MGLFGFDSNKTDASQNYTDQRVAATEQATSLAAYDKSRVVGPGSISAERSNVALTDQSVVNTYIKSLDPKVAEAAFATYESLADTYADALSDRENTLGKVFAGFFGPVMGQLSDLSMSKQTDGESERDKTVLFIVIGLLALVGFIFWRHR